MTNGEKYRTAKERVEAFYKYCETEHHTVSACCALNWLDLEAPDEEPLPCPFCGDECDSDKDEEGNWIVFCNNCLYTMGGQEWSEEECIKRHNRVARAAKEKEAK